MRLLPKMLTLFGTTARIMRQIQHVAARISDALVLIEIKSEKWVGILVFQGVKVINYILYNGNGLCPNYLCLLAHTTLGNNTAYKLCNCFVLNIEFQDCFQQTTTGNVLWHYRNGLVFI